MPVGSRTDSVRRVSPNLWRCHRVLARTGQDRLPTWVRCRCTAICRISHADDTLINGFRSESLGASVSRRGPCPGPSNGALAP